MSWIPASVCSLKWQTTCWQNREFFFLSVEIFEIFLMGGLRCEFVLVFAEKSLLWLFFLRDRVLLSGIFGFVNRVI